MKGKQIIIKRLFVTSVTWVLIFLFKKSLRKLRKLNGIYNSGNGMRNSTAGPFPEMEIPNVNDSDMGFHTAGEKKERLSECKKIGRRGECLRRPSCPLPGRIKSPDSTLRQEVHFDVFHSFNNILVYKLRTVLLTNHSHFFIYLAQ